MVLGTPIHEIGNPSYWRIFLQLLLILMIAELSYRFIEMPIRKEGFRVYCQKYLICNKTSGKPYFSTKNINGYGSSFSACIFTGMTGVVGESQQNPSKTLPTTIKINGEEPTANLNKQDKQAEASTDKPSQSKDEGVEDVQKIETPKQEENNTIIEPEKDEFYRGILAIGDS